MEICRGTLQPKKPQEVPWQYAVVHCSQAPGGALCMYVCMYVEVLPGGTRRDHGNMAWYLAA